MSLCTLGGVLLLFRDPENKDFAAVIFFLLNDFDAITGTNLPTYLYIYTDISEMLSV